MAQNHEVHSTVNLVLVSTNSQFSIQGNTDSSKYYRNDGRNKIQTRNLILYQQLSRQVQFSCLSCPITPSPPPLPSPPCLLSHKGLIDFALCTPAWQALSENSRTWDQTREESAFLNLTIPLVHWVLCADQFEASTPSRENSLAFSCRRCTRGGLGTESRLAEVRNLNRKWQVKERGGAVETSSTHNAL